MAERHVSREPRRHGERQATEFGTRAGEEARRRPQRDMADLLGLADARFAVEVAAAGGHHLMLSGPKGAGKTTLAERIPGILPDLSPQEALELTARRVLIDMEGEAFDRIYELD